ncbi:Xylan 1,4-beta-xylosidase [Pontiella desulfatans]|uniref:Xylan 1,4-beta-xylosidase n=1 Tax=Pontiella desulfatans TaxID=2750659 RepID=A0A6C2U9K9_PONDE|nr:glycoside hydrolase family 3 C-terminal domain-containing protein [Pontiella desulfatans]VGO16543.1 Xylan 1,4-beta-xylosidase [Pontiella desulfatans]
MIKAQFSLSGDIRHSKTLGAFDARKPEVYVEEISGTSFIASAPGLEPGAYLVEIDLVEAVLDGVGQRVMDIQCGNAVLAQDLDLVVAAGGFKQPYRVSGTVEHLGDAQRGPLAVQFEGRVQEAKFNAITVKDEAGDVVAHVLARDLADAVDPDARIVPHVDEPPVYNDPSHPLEKRVDDLIRRMSPKEKIDQLVNAAGQIERLDVPGYDYWNECLHGVARNGYATVFPQATGMAAIWDAPMMRRIADAISTEARAKFNALGKVPVYHRNQGLTMWSPTLNLFRDPRWGRGQESYGEDPFLTARLGVEFIRGLQGDDGTYLKVAACAKHYAAHSGPEPGRRSFDVSPTARDLYETYLPQFEAAVREGGVEAVMGAYNSLYDEPCNTSHFLLTELLRGQWGFDGHVVADCGAIRSVYAHHRHVGTAEEAVALAVKAGCDLDCGVTFGSLLTARKEGLVSDEEIDRALHRLLRTRFRLGMFDPPAMNPWSKITLEQNDSPEHQALALEATRKSLVLLKNDGILPLGKSALKKVAVIGANADSVPALLGNYHGDPSAPVTFLDGVRAALGDAVEIIYDVGCPLALPKDDPEIDPSWFADALRLAAASDVVLYFGGISGELEGEEMPVNMEGFNGGDRTFIELPPVQTALLKKLHATGTPVVFINSSGGAVAFPWEAENLPAILQAWYPGQAGGTAVADVLFGACNPSGKLPLTFYRSTKDLPHYYDYGMANRTYRFFEGEPLYAFGHGLGYTRFEYGALTASEDAGIFRVSFELANAGAVDGEEVVQLYVRHLASSVSQPIHSLAAFQRLAVGGGERAMVELEFPVDALRHWDGEGGGYVVEPGGFEVRVGASSADIRQTLELQVQGRGEF